MQNLGNKLKNIVLVQVIIILLLIGVGIASSALVSKMTENLTYGYSIKLTK